MLTDLQRRTALQSNFGAILLALVDGQPQQLSMKQLLQTFLDFRELTLIRRTSYALRKTEDRLEVVEGLITALNNLQAVIAMIQEANDAASARASLMVRLEITERQADSVLAMPLRRLTGLEQESLRQELDELRTERQRLKLLLDNRDQMLDAMVAEFKTLKKRFATPRRTRLIEGGDALIAERTASQRPNTELLRQQALSALPGDGRVLIQADGQVKIVTPQVLGRLHYSEPCPLGESPSPARVVLPIEPPPRLLAISASGRIALLRWEFAGQQPGSLERFLPTGLEGDPVVTITRLPNQASEDMSLGLLSSDGRFKRLPLAEILDLSGRATSVVKLKEGITLNSAVICRDHQDLLLFSDIGRVLQIPIRETTLPLMGRLAQGPMTMRLLPGEGLIGALCPEQPSVLLVSREGRISRLDCSSLRRSERGDLGSIGVKISSDQDRIAGVAEARGLIGVISSQERHGRLDALSYDSRNPGEHFQDQLALRDGESVTEIIPALSD